MNVYFLLLVNADHQSTERLLKVKDKCDLHITEKLKRNYIFPIVQHSRKN